MNEVVLLDATALSAAIHKRDVSCAEVMEAYLQHIGRMNPKVNAIVALRDGDALMDEARQRDRELAQGHDRGALHGIPQAIKDLEPQKDFPLTMGSPLLRSFMPPEDGVMAARIRASGAIFLGRTNTPEFGLGSHSYNLVHGRTGNAYDPSKSAGGSSGGAAVALALRMLPVADGGDFMGSLRNPAGWNNIYSLRPCVGRVPSNTRDVWVTPMSTLGPMARSVRDLALLFDIQQGPDTRVPLMMDGRLDVSPARLERNITGMRVGWLGDLGGFLPFEPEVLDVCRAGLKQIEGMGCIVEDVLPDFDLDVLWSSFQTLRAWQSGSGIYPLYRDPEKRKFIKPEAIYEIERGAKVSGYEISHASAQRTQWYVAVCKLFERFDFLILPSSQMFPFDVEIDWPRHVGGVKMEHYYDWMKVMVPATMSGSPVVTVPAGFSAGGLPIGLQVMAPNLQELTCLQFALAHERATGWVEKRLPGAMGHPI